MTRRLRLFAGLAFTTLLIPALALRAQQPAAKDAASQAPADSSASKAKDDPIDRIRDEGLNRSQVMKTISYLTDVIGPRLTASPEMKRANEWTRDTMTSWGMQNGKLEPWGPFGRGWTLKKFSAQVVEPQCIPLIAVPRAWSPGTSGPVVAEVVYLDARTVEDLEKFKGKLAGKFVLTSTPRDVEAHFEAQGVRMTDSDLLRLADASEPGARRAGAPTKAAPPAEAARKDETAKAQPRPAPPGFSRAEFELQRKKLAFLVEEKPAGLLEPSSRGDGGTLFVDSARVPAPAGVGTEPGARRVSSWDKDAPEIPPQVVVAREHYNRLVRMIQQGETPRLELDLAVQFHDADLMGYNTTAEIPGTDLKDEVVMLGGHMDSWHGGTGATDNAAGVAVAMEAARIIQTLGLKPRRTIRVALWSGEEQGLFGSRAYVKDHFGQIRDGSPAARLAAANGGESAKLVSKPEYDQFSAYFNLDNGTGKIRGVYLQGNESVRPLFRRWLAPFRDLGAGTLSIANTGGTDHLSFDGIGLPGFQFIQDPIEYETRTHHSNQDVYDRIQAEDMKQASVIMAAFVYNTAMMDEKMPRKPAAPRATPPATQ